MNIVVAEDDALLRMILTDLLANEAEFHVVGTAATGQEALEVVSHLRPDVLLLDLNLPNLPGMAVLEQLAEVAEGPAILVLSGDDREETQVEAARLGARGFLSKAQALPTLSSAIRTIGSGGMWFSPHVAEQILREYRRLVRRTRERDDPLGKLSPQEREVVICIARGMTNQKIASELHLSLHTVKFYVQSIFRKLNLPNRTEAAVLAARLGLLNGDDEEGTSAD